MLLAVVVELVGAVEIELVARRVALAIAARNKDFSSKFPSITISKTT